MKLAIAIIAALALAILAFSAAWFETTTVLVIALALVIVAFFSGSAVALGVLTRRIERRGSGAPNDPDAEVIHPNPGTEHEQG